VWQFANEPVQVRQTLSTQGYLWTERIPTAEKLEYMAFPRLIALAEVAWSSQTKRNYDDFLRRLSPNLQRLSRLNINYYH